MNGPSREITDVPGHWALRSLFEEICDLCAAVYRDAWQRPLLHLVVPRGRPGTRDGGAAAGWAGAGCTGGQGSPGVSTLTAQPPEGPPVVQLTLSGGRFGGDTVPVLARTLLHQCFCHVRAGHHDSHDGSPFVEGWLDWAGDFPFRRWAAGSGTGPAEPRHIQESRGALSLRTAGSQARDTGRGAAENLRAWLRENRCADRTAQVLTARLALEVNLADRELARKDELTVLLARDRYPSTLVHALDGWGATPADGPRLQAEQVLDTVMG